MAIYAEGYMIIINNNVLLLCQIKLYLSQLHICRGNSPLDSNFEFGFSKVRGSARAACVYHSVDVQQSPTPAGDRVSRALKLKTNNLQIKINRVRLP